MSPLARELQYSLTGKTNGRRRTTRAGGMDLPVHRPSPAVGYGGVGIIDVRHTGGDPIEKE